MNRRNLLRNGALAGAAAFLPVTAGFAGLHSAIAAYSRQVATRPTPDGSVHLVASIDDLQAFTQNGVHLQAPTSTNIHAEGNILSFTHNGTAYRIENVLPENFARAIA